MIQENQQNRPPPRGAPAAAPSPNGNSRQQVEDLAVFQCSRKLALAVHKLTKGAGFAGEPALAGQLRLRSADILSRILDGMDRSSYADRIPPLSEAKGRCSEVQAQLLLAGDLGAADPQACAPLVEECRHVSLMLGKLIGYFRKNLNNPDHAHPARQAAA